MRRTPKNLICLWYDKDALAAARFYAKTFPKSKVTAVPKAPTMEMGKIDVAKIKAARRGPPRNGRKAVSRRKR